MVRQGYMAIKWFFRDGPTDGVAGMHRNLRLVCTLRESGTRSAMRINASLRWGDIRQWQARLYVTWVAPALCRATHAHSATN
jgi:hypothetical protein